VLADIGPLVDGTLEGAERVRDIVQDLRRFSASQREPLETFNLVRLIHTAGDWVLKALRDPPELRLDLPEKLDVTSRKGSCTRSSSIWCRMPPMRLKGARAGSSPFPLPPWARTCACAWPTTAPALRLRIRTRSSSLFHHQAHRHRHGAGPLCQLQHGGQAGGSLDYADAPGGALFTLRLPLVSHDGRADNA
jgi:two-component system sensor histidine kinase HupT/HoxJ